MAENGAPMTLFTPGGDVALNTRAASEFFVDDTEGLDGVPLRTPQEDASQTDGELDFDYFFKGRHITIRGFLLTDGSLSMVNQVAQRNNMEYALKAACQSIIRASGTFQYSPTGLAVVTYTVKCDVQPTFPGKSPKEFVFGLFAKNPFS